MNTIRRNFFISIFFLRGHKKGNLTLSSKVNSVISLDHHNVTLSCNVCCAPMLFVLHNAGVLMKNDDERKLFPISFYISVAGGS